MKSPFLRSKTTNKGPTESQGNHHLLSFSAINKKKGEANFARECVRERERKTMFSSPKIRRSHNNRRAPNAVGWEFFTARSLHTGHLLIYRIHGPLAKTRPSAFNKMPVLVLFESLRTDTATSDSPKKDISKDISWSGRERRRDPLPIYANVYWVVWVARKRILIVFFRSR
jgi:hypothetical protein